MNRFRCVWRFSALLALLACGMGSIACQLTPTDDDEQASTEATAAALQTDQELVIQNDSELPVTYPHEPYQVHLVAHGGVSPLHWRVEAGSLPPGIKLEDDGLLRGAAERAGEFQFTASVRDGGAAVQKRFVILVREALVLNWKSAAHVTGNRIEGSVEVTNTTPDDMDLTFDVKAVAENGRATEIGYQHFVLLRGTIAKELPFGETLPHGGYVVHVDAVGEVAPKKLIYRERMQTPGALQVTVGP